MSTKNFIWYAIPLLFFLILLWLFEPFIYQKLFASTELSTIINKEFKIIAHRGASGHAPENTLASIEKAIVMGAEMIDIDVHLTKDNHIVVIHDELVDRTTNGTGKVHEKTLEEIKALDAGSWFSPIFKNEKVPTLSEVLTLIDGRTQCLIEIKSKEHTIYDGFSKQLVEEIHGHNAMEWTVIQSYEDEYLDLVYDFAPDVKTKKIIMGEDEPHLLSFFIQSKHFVSNRVQHHYLESVNPQFEALSIRRVHKLKARGYKVYTYVVNEREDMLKMLNMGVNGIITDFPDRLHEIKEELHK